MNGEAVSPAKQGSPDAGQRRKSKTNKRKSDNRLTAVVEKEEEIIAISSCIDAVDATEKRNGRFLVRRGKEYLFASPSTRQC